MQLNMNKIYLRTFLHHRDTFWWPLLFDTSPWRSVFFYFFFTAWGRNYLKKSNLVILKGILLQRAKSKVKEIYHSSGWTSVLSVPLSEPSVLTVKDEALVSSSFTFIFLFPSCLFVCPCPLSGRADVAVFAALQPSRYYCVLYIEQEGYSDTFQHVTSQRKCKIFSRIKA